MPRAINISAEPVQTSRSGVTTCTSSGTGYAASICLACATASSMPPTRKNACSGRWSYSPSHSPLNDAIVSSTGVYLPGHARELLGHEDRLRQELLDLPGTRHDDLVLLGQLVDAEDRDDVLQVLVPLQDLLHAPRDRVVLLADVARVEDPAARVERVHGRVDPERRDVAREHGRGVQVRERRVRRRVRDVVRGHVDRLQGRDRTAAGRRDPFLQRAHLARQVRLVADGARHPAEQRGDLRPRLREAEDVVHEQQHVQVDLVAEVLGHRERRERHAKAHAGRLVHLAEHQRGLRPGRPTRSSPGRGRCPHGCARRRRRTRTRRRAAPPGGGSSPG